MRLLAAAAILPFLVALAGAPALADNKVRTETIAPPSGPEAEMPGPDTPGPAGSGVGAPAGTAGEAQDEDAQSEPLPEIHYGVDGLPKPVARTREQIEEAAATGLIEKLKPLIEANDPTLSFGQIGDPIEFLRTSSGDGEGREVLAILLDVLNAGWVRVDVDTPQEMYVWPYFARYPLDKLTPGQLVEAYRVMTSYDFDRAREFGAYNFYRLGISPDGSWRYFVQGD